MSRLIQLLKFIIWLPFRALQSLFRAAFRFLGSILSPLTHQIDASSSLSRLIDTLSSSMATQRGLLLLLGTVLVLLSLLVHGVVVTMLATSSDFGSQLYWFCIPFSLLHLAVLFGFTGIMLATPLGQGYKDK